MIGTAKEEAPYLSVYHCIVPKVWLSWCLPNEWRGVNPLCWLSGSAEGKGSQEVILPRE